MVYCYVVGRSRGIRIACDGPVTRQVGQCELAESGKMDGYPLDIEVEFPKKPRRPVLLGAERK